MSEKLETVILFYFQGLVWLNVLVSTNDGKSNSEKTTSPIQYLQIESNHEGYRCFYSISTYSLNMIYTVFSELVRNYTLQYYEAHDTEESLR